MGSDLRHKGILLDEADFALPRDCDMETLVKAVEEYCEAEFQYEDEYPLLEVLGVAAEGFDETVDYSSFGSRAVWLKPNTGFRDVFIKLANGLGLPEALAASTIDTGRTEDLETYLKDRIRTHLDERDFYGARHVMEQLPQLRSIGLPGVQDAGEFDTRGRDMIVDWRVNNYGLGRRVLVEIAFDWGQ